MVSESKHFQNMKPAREVLNFDVVIVGGGPAGLACACRFLQLAKSENKAINLCVLEKGAEIGAHNLSGALLETRVLDELFPDWAASGAPARLKVSRESLHLLVGERTHWRIPEVFVPESLHNEGNYIVSLGQLCRWLGQQAEARGAQIFPGFPAVELIYGPNGEVIGVATGNVGVNRDGSPKAQFQPGVELRAPYTVIAEGCRGQLTQELVARYELQDGRDPPHYGLGIKEIWEIPQKRHQAGSILHTMGWPLDTATGGGGFLYHGENNRVFLGLIVALNYRNPYLSPFQEMQRWKHHPLIAATLAEGRRIAYGALTLNKGGLQSVPRLHFPGGLLAGCAAGLLDTAKLKGIHTALKTGMMAAESVFDAMAGRGKLEDIETKMRDSWVYQDLYKHRNFNPAQARFGWPLGGALYWLDQAVFRGRSPFTLRDEIPDHASLHKAAACRPIPYPKPDGVLSFDMASSVYLSNTHHEEEQPCHLRLGDPEIPLNNNLPIYDEPAQRYCPAGVYEVVRDDRGCRFEIHAANCLHCKTCEIKDPAQNITWTAPEGGGGPNYAEM